MKSTRHLPAVLGAIALVTAGIFAALNRAALSDWAFDLTGEEALAGQVRGLGQLALGLPHKPLQLDPYAEIDYSGLNPYGINTFLHLEVEPAKREEQLRLISAAGYRWIRQEFPWEDIEISGRGDFIDRRNDPAGVDAWEHHTP